MLLNIYILSHPIIKLLSPSITKLNTSKEINYDKIKYIGLFLIYEITRRYINVESIYIKKVSYTKEIHLPKKNEQYYIITDLIKTYKTIGEVQNLIPNLKILHVNNQQQLSNIYIKEENNCLNQNKQIIIFENIITTYLVMNLVEQLIDKNNIKIKNIHITCIACYTQILNKLGKKYPELNLYTTKII
uniref:Uracil phosphoribosyltransferase n=1 Tax=Dasya naccarioides TaxID=2007180 RepID=A0A1Z1MHC7_9FLOR|nr:uracil phosphoribosyltransferase [Dasya naccarioides]ARW65279.1 uracil phosphoribosyltransferase [Dasya naccarioides]